MEFKLVEFFYDPNFGCFDVIDEVMLNFVDNNDKDNNRFYKIELWLSEKGEYRIHVIYGMPVSKSHKKFVILCKNQKFAYKTYNFLIKDRIDKGYINITSSKTLNIWNLIPQLILEHKESQVIANNKNYKLCSNLDGIIQDLIKDWTDSAENFILENIDIAKCPLSQISSERIDLGINILKDIRKAIDEKKEITVINKLTGLYLNNIPYIFPEKTTVNMIRIDNYKKIDAHINALNVISSIKALNNIFFKKSIVDLQYKLLLSDIKFLEKEDPICKWIRKFFIKNNKVKIISVFKIKKQKDEGNFINSLDVICEKCLSEYVPNELQELAYKRPDLDKDQIDIYKAANVFPLWYGLGKENMYGLIANGLLGKSFINNTFGDGLYFYSNLDVLNDLDIKSDTSQYLLLCDVITGNAKIAENQEQFSTESINPYNSVWAKKNNQFIIYTGTGSNQQYNIRYIVKVEKK